MNFSGYDKVRSSIYKLLSNIYSTIPAISLIKFLNEIEIFNYLVNFECFENFNNDIYVILEYLKNSTNNEEVLEELRQDFMRLFIGPYILIAPPWESVYLSNEKIVFQKPAIEVRHEYLKMGLAPEKIFIEPDDHISLELEFMYYLCVKENGNNDKDYLRTTEINFLKEHILKWVPIFCNDIVKHAQTKFYSGVGNFTNKFLHLDLNYMEKNRNSGC